MVLRLKLLRSKAALVRMILRSHSGCFLPASVVAELELNSVIPPPDMIEEEDETVKSVRAMPLHEAKSG